MVVRTPWNEFPPVTVQTRVADLKGHPAYPDAKNGDLKAARRLVADLFKNDKLPIKVDYVVPVQQVDHDHRWNAIPLAYARHLATKLGAKLLPTIVQDNIVNHTLSDSASRLTNQPSFTGTVPKGNYLIVDDVVALGATLTNLRGYIEHRGASVTMASTMAAAIFSTKLAPDPGLIPSIKRRFPNELSIFPQKLGFPAEFLTNREAYFVNGLRNLEAIRNPLAPTHNIIRPSIG